MRVSALELPFGRAIPKKYRLKSEGQTGGSNIQIRKAILRSLREKGCGQSVGETSEWTALNDFEELEMKRYVILPFPHSSRALFFWGGEEKGTEILSPTNKQY